MAEASLSFALGKLGDLLIQKADFLLGVEAKLQDLKHELHWMQSFLKDASVKQVESERIRTWISDIRELALDAEDAIDSFTLTVDAPRKSRGLMGRCVCFPQHVYHLNKLGSEIESILKKLKVIEERRLKYGITNLEDEAASSTRIDHVEQRRRVCPWQPDKHVVGLEEHVDTLLRKAVFVDRKGLSISSIVGMGGVGKSTLAKALYNHEDVVSQFECRAWVIVSRSFNPKEVMKEVLLKLPGFGEDEINKMKEASEDGLKEMVCQHLRGKQYLIVMDDVWRQQDWNCFKDAFPDDEGKACRVVITSRDNTIPSEAIHIHRLGGLNDKQSRQLFLKAAFNADVDDKCAPELLEVGNQILEKCDGLPLAITVIGGLLLEQGPSVSGWKKVLKEIKSHLGAEKESVNAVLELSYQDLPPQLKSCFLCLSFFEEDAIISARTLVHMWIAEGFILHEEREMTMEEVGMGYLNELINRNMVQAVDVDEVFDKVYCCRIHDSLHELSIRKAREEINFDILQEENTCESLEKGRHLAIRCNKKRFMMLVKNSNLRIRSLIFHGSSATDNDVLCSSSWKSFGGLRVMELEGLGLREVPKETCRLVSLRYLGLQKNNINKLPISMGCLKNLQTLDIWGNRNVKVPNVLWKLNSLRHLYMESDIICKEPLNLDILKDLQTLCWISTRNVVVEDLAKLGSLRVLHVVVSKEEDARKLFASLAMLENLIELYLLWEGDLHRNNEYLRIDGIVNLQHLKTLVIRGRTVKLPQDFPPNLSFLRLRGTEFEQDPMPLLGRLPKLLCLILLDDACIGEEMVIKHNGFPRLKVLGVCFMEKLRKIHIGNKAMLELKVLGIQGSTKLEILPEVEELRMMSNLHELRIVGTSRETESKLKGDKYSDIISKIPSVLITFPGYFPSPDSYYYPS